MTWPVPTSVVASRRHTFDFRAAAAPFGIGRCREQSRVAHSTEEHSTDQCRLLVRDGPGERPALGNQQERSSIMNRICRIVIVDQK